MANRSIHVFENGSTAVAFPNELPVKGRGADHIVLHNSTRFRVIWAVPPGVFDDEDGHREEVAAGEKSERHRVKARRAKAIVYQVVMLQRKGKRLLRRRVRGKSDPVIIIDL